MASTFSPKLRFELIGAGEQVGAWGSTSNVNLGTLVENAIAGTTSLTTTVQKTALTALSGADDQARAAAVKVNTSYGGAFELYVPPSSKLYVIRNISAQQVTVYNSTALGNTTAAGTGAVVAAGTSAAIYTDGTNCYGQDDRYVAADAAVTAAVTAALKKIPNAGANLVTGEMYVATAGFTLNTGLAANNVYPIYNNSAAAITLTQGGGLTLRMAGTTLTGNRTLAARGMASLWCLSTSEYIISGAGVT
jgi:hypothetical protein